MQNRFILNILHRPEMAPEYSAKTTQNGHQEDIQSSSLRNESLEIFELQQKLAHERGLKTTIEMTYASLFNDEAIAMAKADHQRYGDEIALTLLGLPCKQFEEKYHTKDFCIWMFSQKDKRRIIDDVFSLFYAKFGFYPTSTGSYYLDSYSINYIKKKYPMVISAVATCWEEGVKAYHTTNNSWYTFLDGGPWAPWIPSKENTHVPSSGPRNDSGIVAIPHLSRDLIACYDGNGSNFGTHPQNVLRGMIYENDEIPYFYNLVDEYRHQAKYNNGIAYNMMFVGPGWMNKKGRWEAPYELLVKSYADGLDYYAKLKQEGKLTDMTVSEFAVFYRSHKKYKEPEVALWKDILYGSEKEYFWYSDPYLRTCLDFNQGGAMIDLRPYVAKLRIPVGIGTGNAYNASYPYIIEANYRAGYFTHYAGRGTIRSALIRHGSEVVDLCLERTKATFSRVGEDILLTTDPFEIEFASFKFMMRSRFLFKVGSGEIRTTREIISDLHGEEVTVEEYLVGCYGTTEYSEDMTGIILSTTGDKGTKKMAYGYRCRSLVENNATSAEALVPQIKTIVSLGGENIAAKAEEGYAFSPMFRLSVSATLPKGEVTTWLKLKKAV
jgi:hypothetical protein